VVRNVAAEFLRLFCSYWLVDDNYVMTTMMTSSSVSVTRKSDLSPVWCFSSGVSKGGRGIRTPIGNAESPQSALQHETSSSALKNSKTLGRPALSAPNPAGELTALTKPLANGERAGLQHAYTAPPFLGLKYRASGLDKILRTSLQTARHREHS